MKLKLVLSVVLVVALLAVGITTLLKPARGFSELENRVLTGREKLTAESILNGEYQQHIVDYMTDQIPFRDTLATSSSLLKQIVDIKDVGSAYIGRDGYLFEKVTDADINISRYEKNINSLISFADKNKCSLNFMLVPSSGIVLKDKLPDFAPIYNDEALYSLLEEKIIDKKVSMVNVKDSLVEHKNDYIYYKTDHHYTAYGAYICYEELLNGSGKAEYSAKTLCSDFLGTLHSKALTLNQEMDVISLPDYQDVELNADGRVISMYDYSAAETKDKYKVFQGGNYGILTAKRTSPDNNRKLLIIKDSFANTMLPYLSYDYDEITMIDLRYFSGSISSIIEATDTKDILVLYELNNFATDTNLSKLVMG